MKRYNIIKLTSGRELEFEDLSRNFSESVAKTCVNNYSNRINRGSNFFDKIKKDIYIGKICELHTQRYLQEKCVKITSEVDMAIYDSKQKSFSHDIEVEIKNQKIGISCKSSYIERYGSIYDLNKKYLGDCNRQHSYVIQEEDSIYRDCIGHNITFFTNYLNNGDVELVGWVDNKLVDNMFVLPFNKNYWGRFENGKWTGKKCIMYKTCCNEGFPCGIEELPLIIGA